MSISSRARPSAWPWAARGSTLPTQTRKTELVQYGDYAPYGLPLSGNAPSQVGTGQAMLPMFWTATGTTKKNTRDGLMAVVEYQPNDQLHTQLDLLLAVQDARSGRQNLVQSLFGNWSAGISTALSNVSTVQRGDDTYATAATASAMVANVGNFDTRRTDDISAVGWNTELKFADKWKLVSDLAFSRDKRAERYAEAYAGPYNSATKELDLRRLPLERAHRRQRRADLHPASTPSCWPTRTAWPLATCRAWTGCPMRPGLAPSATRRDRRGQVRPPQPAPRSRWLLEPPAVRPQPHPARQGRGQNEDRILMKKDSAGNYIRSIPASSVRAPFDMGWAGIPALLRVDVPDLVASGQYQLEEGQFSKWVANNPAWARRSPPPLQGRLRP